MSGAALSKEAMLISLRDIHLPVDAPGGLIAELAASTAIATGAAIVVVLVLRLFSLRVSHPAKVETDESGPHNWSDERMRIALLHQLRKQNPQRYAALSADLYKPGPAPELHALKAEVRPHA